MPKAKSIPFRKIAENLVGQCFPARSPAERDRFATSLVRQLISNNGAAVLATLDRLFVFHLTPGPDGTSEVAQTVKPNGFCDLLRRRGVDEDEIPGLLNELSVRQLARCVNRDGEVLQLRVDPSKGMFFIEPAPDAEE